MDSPVVDNVVSLDALPTEILLLIFEHIDAKTLIHSLMYLNKLFYSIINDTYLWKKRFLCKYKNNNVAFMLTKSYNECAFNWKQFSWHTEMEEDCWSDYKTNTTTTTFSGAHFSEVDTVMMTTKGNHCISASRDRSMCLWDTIGMAKDPIVYKSNSHSGWVWDLGMYDENHFLSCSWDSSVKLWSLNNFLPNSDPIRVFRTSAAVLSIASKLNFVVAGLYIAKIIAFDPREDGRSLFEIYPHRRSIIDVRLIQDNYLVSLSEDKTLSVCDLRTNKTFKTIHMTKHGSTGFPLCASYYNNVLFVGDNQYGMFWFDCSNGLFNFLEAVKFVKPTNDNRMLNKLNVIKCTNYGSIIIGGNDGVVHIITPSNPPKIIASMDSRSEITSIDYQNNTLVVGYVNSGIQVWKKSNE